MSTNSAPVHPPAGAKSVNGPPAIDCTKGDGAGDRDGVDEADGEGETGEGEGEGEKDGDTELDGEIDGTLYTHRSTTLVLFCGPTHGSVPK